MRGERRMKVYTQCRLKLCGRGETGEVWGGDVTEVRGAQGSVDFTVRSV